MKLIKATITNGIVKTNLEETLPTDDVIIIGKTQDSSTRDGILIVDEEKFYFIDIAIISNLQVAVLDLIISALNQVITSVVSSKTTTAGNPIETTISDDLSPIIQQITDLKGTI